MLEHCLSLRSDSLSLSGTVSGEVASGTELLGFPSMLFVRLESRIKMFPNPLRLLVLTSLGTLKPTLLQCWILTLVRGDL